MATDRPEVSPTVEASAPTLRVHATVIALADRAALIRGPSGAGKSDLALRCLATGTSPLLPVAARLIADDYVDLHQDAGRLVATAPAPLSGHMEVRGLGIIEVAPQASATLALIVDLVPHGEIERLPDPLPTELLLGTPVPVLRLDAFEPSAPIKLLLALASSLPIALHLQWGEG